RATARTGGDGRRGRLGVEADDPRGEEAPVRGRLADEHDVAVGLERGAEGDGVDGTESARRRHSVPTEGDVRCAVGKVARGQEALLAIAAHEADADELAVRLCEQGV